MSTLKGDNREYELDTIVQRINRKEPLPGDFARALDRIAGITRNKGIYTVKFKDLCAALKIILVPGDYDEKTMIVSTEYLYRVVSIMLRAGISMVPLAVPRNLSIYQSIYLTPRPDLNLDQDIYDLQRIANLKKTSLTNNEKDIIMRARTKLANYNIMLHVFEFLGAAQSAPLDANQRMVLNSAIMDMMLPRDAERYIKSLFSFVCEFGSFFYDFSNPKYIAPKPAEWTEEQIVEIINLVSRIVGASKVEISIPEDFPYARLLRERYAVYTPATYGSTPTSAPAPSVQPSSYIPVSQRPLGSLSFNQRRARVKGMYKDFITWSSQESDRDFELNNTSFNREILLQARPGYNQDFIRRLASVDVSDDSNISSMMQDLQSRLMVDHQARLTIPDFASTRLVLYVCDGRQDDAATALQMKNSAITAFKLTGGFTRVDGADGAESAAGAVGDSAAGDSTAGADAAAGAGAASSGLVDGSPYSQESFVSNGPSDQDRIAWARTADNALRQAMYRESHASTHELINTVSFATPDALARRACINAEQAHAAAAAAGRSSPAVARNAEAAAASVREGKSHESLVTVSCPVSAGNNEPGRSRSTSAEVDPSLFKDDSRSPKKARRNPSAVPIANVLSDEAFHVVPYTSDYVNLMVHNYLVWAENADQVANDPVRVRPSINSDYGSNLEQFIYSPLKQMPRLNKVLGFEFILRRFFAPSAAPSILDSNGVSDEQTVERFFEIAVLNDFLINNCNPVPFLFYHSLYYFDRHLQNPVTHFNNELFYCALFRHEPYAINIYLSRIINKYGSRLVDIPEEFYTLLALNLLMFTDSRCDLSADYALKVLMRNTIKNRPFFKVVLIRTIATALYHEAHRPGNEDARLVLSDQNLNIYLRTVKALNSRGDLMITKAMQQLGNALPAFYFHELFSPAEFIEVARITACNVMKRAQGDSRTQAFTDAIDALTEHLEQMQPGELLRIGSNLLAAFREALSILWQGARSPTSMESNQIRHYRSNIFKDEFQDLGVAVAQALGQKYSDPGTGTATGASTAAAAPSGAAAPAAAAAQADAAQDDEDAAQKMASDLRKGVESMDLDDAVPVYSATRRIRRKKDEQKFADEEAEREDIYQDYARRFGLSDDYTHVSEEPLALFSGTGISSEVHDDAAAASGAAGAAGAAAAKASAGRGRSKAGTTGAASSRKNRARALHADQAVDSGRGRIRFGDAAAMRKAQPEVIAELEDVIRPNHSVLQSMSDQITRNVSDGLSAEGIAVSDLMYELEHLLERLGLLINGGRAGRKDSDELRRSSARVISRLNFLFLEYCATRRAVDLAGAYTGEVENDDNQEKLNHLLSPEWDYVFGKGSLFADEFTGNLYDKYVVPVLRKVLCSDHSRFYRIQGKVDISRELGLIPQRIASNYIREYFIPGIAYNRFIVDCAVNRDWPERLEALRRFALQVNDAYHIGFPKGISIGHMPEVSSLLSSSIGVQVVPYYLTNTTGTSFNVLRRSISHIRILSIPQLYQDASMKSAYDDFLFSLYCAYVVLELMNSLLPVSDEQGLVSLLAHEVVSCHHLQRYNDCVSFACEYLDSCARIIRLEGPLKVKDVFDSSYSLPVALLGNRGTTRLRQMLALAFGFEIDKGFVVDLACAQYTTILRRLQFLEPVILSSASARHDPAPKGDLAAFARALENGEYDSARNKRMRDNMARTRRLAEERRRADGRPYMDPPGSHSWRSSVFIPQSQKPLTLDMEKVKAKLAESEQVQAVITQLRDEEMARQQEQFDSARYGGYDSTAPAPASAAASTAASAVGAAAAAGLSPDNSNYVSGALQGAQAIEQNQQLHSAGQKGAVAEAQDRERSAAAAHTSEQGQVVSESTHPINSMLNAKTREVIEAIAIQGTDAMVFSEFNGICVSHGLLSGNYCIEALNEYAFEVYDEPVLELEGEGDSAIVYITTDLINEMYQQCLDLKKV